METHTLHPYVISHDRRSKPRMQCSFPACIRSQARDRHPHETPAVLSNMSASGMYLRLKHHLQPGERIFIAARLSTAPLERAHAPRLVALGTVLRTELLPDGSYAIGVHLARHRFL